MKKFCSIMLFLFAFILCFPSNAQAATDTYIRVSLATGASNISLNIVSGTYTVSGGMSLESPTAASGDVITLTKSGGYWQVSINGATILDMYTSVTFSPINSTDQNIIKYNNVQYRDSFHITSSNRVVNVVQLEHYLYGVVGKEMGYSAPYEALKAQAVASRSYAMSYLGSNTEYDLLSTTTSQVYGGYDAEIVTNGSRVISAVNETAGEVMYYQLSSGANVLVQAFYHASAGGYTEDSENVWNETIEYLRGVSSPYDVNSHVWTVTCTTAEIASLAQSYMASQGITGNFGTYQGINIYTDNRFCTGTSASGRLTKIEVIGTGATVTVYRNNIRTFFGGLKSTLFNISGPGVAAPSSNTATIYVKDAYGSLAGKSLADIFAMGKSTIVQALSGLSSNIYVISSDGVGVLGSGTSVASSTGTQITINGRGNGHGVGMSQIGAQGMANAGYDYKAILSHYYGGLDPTKLSFVTK